MKYLFLLFVAVLFVVGCTPHSMMHHPQVTSEEQFIAEMIPHHQEAIDSSRLMLSSSDPDVVVLAQSIIAAQESEVTMMNNWMHEWYPSSQYRTTYVPMMPDLSVLDGQVRDRAYLEGMIGHHQGAIEMAYQAQSLELRPEVRALTEAIVRDQQHEITAMKNILKN